MKRIYSYYSDDEYLLLSKASEEMGMTLSAYQKYISLLRLKRTNSFNLNSLITEMKKNLSQLDVGVKFIAATLLKEKWPSLTRSQKCTIAKILSTEIKSNPRVYQKVGTISGNISQYVKI